MAYGMTSNVLWNFQNSFGTSQTTSLQAIPIISESLTENIEQLIETGMYNRLSESPTHEGPHIVEGEIAVEALPTIMGWFLKSSVGLTSTTSGTGIQTHIFKPRTADFDDRAAGNPTTIEIHRDIAGAFVYQSMLGNQLSFNIANGELLKMDLSLMGTQVTSKAAASPTYPTDPPFQWDQCSAYFNGWAVSNLRNLTVTFGNQLEAVHTHNSANFPYRIKRTGHQQVSISGSMVFETHSLGDAFKNQNELPLVLMFTNSAAPHTFKMDFPALRFSRFSTNIAAAGLIESTFEARAVYKASSDTTCEFTLVNTQTYY